MKQTKQSLEYYLALPYAIEISPIPQDDGGGYCARLPQFGVAGIIGDGETIEEALASQFEEIGRWRDAKLFPLTRLNLRYVHDPLAEIEEDAGGGVRLKDEDVEIDERPDDLDYDIPF